ncbi:MAG: phenylalanine--tRNA ligase subunit alpha, partial [Chloroflexota bacterium]
GREVETTRYNFDGLNMPPWHPARSPHNSLFLDAHTLLRTETSPSQIRVMEARKPPVYMISHGRVYRRDTIDATHYPIFHQVEGLAVDRGITLADLKGTLLYLMRALFGEERQVRFRTHYFPFTEPSLEPDVSCFLCESEGCRTCRYSGWLEMGGSGMVDPAVLEFVGYDPEEVSGFAFGLGLERMAQLRHGIPDIRLLWQSDLRVLEQF